jgi:hypothetical protein
VTKWKATIAAFANELRGNGPKAVQGQQTHGKKGVLRWILHVSSAYHPELERLDERVYLIDLNNEDEVRGAVMGLITVQAMANGDDFQYVNEVELVWGDKDSSIQDTHLDGAWEGVLACTINLLGEPVASTWHTDRCGCRHGDPTTMSTREHGWRAHCMRNDTVCPTGVHRADPLLPVSEHQ